MLMNENTPFFFNLSDHHLEDLSRPINIYDANSLTEDVPEGFQAIAISLDGKIEADLNWKEARKTAKQYVDKGLKVFWHLDMGLFKHLKCNLTEQPQFLALGLSLQYFIDVIWKEFNAHTIGICLFRGSIDFTKGFHWDEHQIVNLRDWFKDRFADISALNEELAASFSHFDSVTPSSLDEYHQGKNLIALFCRDVCLEYLHLLAGKLPKEMTKYILLETTDIIDPQLLCQLLNKERFGHFVVAMTQGAVPIQSFYYEDRSLHGYLSRKILPAPADFDATVGVCWPSMDLCLSHCFDDLSRAMKILSQRNIPYRIIPEMLLTTQWDGLDIMFVSPSSLSFSGRRKLQGFCAAGGMIVWAGDRSLQGGLPQEMMAADFFKKE